MLCLARPDYNREYTHGEKMDKKKKQGTKNCHCYFYHQSDFLNTYTTKKHSIIESEIKLNKKRERL